MRVRYRGLACALTRFQNDVCCRDASLSSTSGPLIVIGDCAAAAAAARETARCTLALQLEPWFDSTRQYSDSIPTVPDSSDSLDSTV